MESASKVKVAVRVRPLNRREIDLGTDICIDMEDNQTLLSCPEHERKPKRTFAYDYSFWSMDESNEKFAGQEKVYNCLGKGVVVNAFDGYNACIFAYGQTGSGKSYTMMGAPCAKGLIPRICDNLFDCISEKHDRDNNLNFKVEVSYMEIYNEKVRDLLCPKSDKQNLKVREHKVLGPYVDGLSKLVVSSFQDIENLMAEGNKSRTVAATMMNAESSRSHAVFNVVLTQRIFDKPTQSIGEKVSKLSLVDLAGSERVSKTGAAGERLKEGGNINKSLSTLGLVISALADQASGKHRKGFVPYRDSVLTWLLKDNLGGNSKTVMVATISPAADNYEETLSTLRYADRAKRIENHAIVNEDPNAKIIRELKEEVERLRGLLQSKSIDPGSISLSKSGRDSTETGSIREELAENEKLIQECTKTWEEKEKQTEIIHKERHKILEEMGISVQDSGIGVKEGRYFLVNLNADPSLNELLVYYLKPHTLVVRHNAITPQDIQLSGLGILKEHCVIDIDDEIVYLEPLSSGRTCVNGQQLSERTQLRHGDRILLGNNYFFRLNCPHSANQIQETDLNQTVDFDFAQTELMLNEFQSLGEPIKDIIKQLEQHHEKEKQGALEEQRKQYEEEIERLRRHTPIDSMPETFHTNDGRISLTTSGYGSRLSDREGSNANLLDYRNHDILESQDMTFEDNVRILREEVLRANSFVREANQLSNEMGKNIEYAVTLQIPTSSLSLGRNKAPLTSEVAIIVKHAKRGTQVWSVEKLKNKLYGMRDLYEQSVVEGNSSRKEDDNHDDDGLFFEVECHTLIGIATIWLECLFENVPLDYAAPIISQQGEVCGKLMVDIRNIKDEYDSESHSSVDSEVEEEKFEIGRAIHVQVTINEATGLPPTLCNYVFCQYVLYDQPLTVVPPIDIAASANGMPKSNAIQFQHSQVFVLDICDDFLEYISESPLAVEVYGNRSQGYESPERYALKFPREQTDIKTPEERWNELIRKIELWTEIHELNEQGTYSPVELQTKDAAECGGVFQLKQGFSRRLAVQVTVPKQGNLPVVLERIKGLAIGSVNVRAKIQKGLDSYQERDLQRLRDTWSNSLLKRREYLDEKIQSLISKSNKTIADREREGHLIDQWVSLTEERNNILCPGPGSGVPGAPLEWDPPPGMERHIPLIFLNLDENVLGGCPDLEPEPAGLKSYIPLEQREKMIDLNILKYDQQKVTAYASWDSSMHDSVYLNRATQNNERVYLVLKVVLRLCSPAVMDLVLRKRICVRIYKKQGLKESLMKKFIRQSAPLSRSGLMYELVSHIPKQSGEETEERQNLARKAADAMTSEKDTLNEDAIERYSKGVTRVENILNLHKLRQRVLLEEKLASVGRSDTSLKKYASTPNLFSGNRTQSLTNLFKASSIFGSNSELTESTSKNTEGEKQQSLNVSNASRSSIATDAVIRRVRQGPRLPANRHSFFGFESGKIDRAYESIADSSPAKCSLPDSYILNANNLSSTPTSKVLLPLIEDEFPVSSSSNSDAIVHDSENSKKRVLLLDSPRNVEKDKESYLFKIDEKPKDMEMLHIPQSSPQKTKYVEDFGANGDAEKLENEKIDTEAKASGSFPVKIGDTIELSKGNSGQVRFVGQTMFADGVWVGLELATPKGKNDGSVNGISYFTCEDCYGLFIRAEKLVSMLHST